MMINSDRWMREVTIPLVAEEIAALCNGVIAGPAMAPGLRPNPSRPGDLDSRMGASCGGKAGCGSTRRLDDGQKRDKSGKWTADPDSHKQLTKGGYKPLKKHADGVHTYQKGSQYAHVFPGGGISINNKRDYYRAADAVAARFMGGHDVSGENRNHGKFAPGKGGGAKPQPTGSPLDPATNQPKPPKMSELHKERMDMHTQAAKTYQALVKQHLDLAKIALDPQDRQKHIDSARQHKQMAAQHLSEAETHAQNHSQALQREAQNVGNAAASAGWSSMGPGAAAGAPPVPAKPFGNQPESPVHAGEHGIPKYNGPGARPLGKEETAPPMPKLDMAKIAAARKQADATAGLMGHPPDPLNQTQQMKPVGAKPPVSKATPQNAGQMATRQAQLNKPGAPVRHDWAAQRRKLAPPDSKQIDQAERDENKRHGGGIHADEHDEGFMLFRRSACGDTLTADECAKLREWIAAHPERLRLKDEEVAE